MPSTASSGRSVASLHSSRQSRGASRAPPFLNTALTLTTSLSPLEVLDRTQEIERQLGRQRKSVAGRYHDRPIDIDLLFYDDLVLESERLTLPHPLLTERLFVLEPLREIAPEFIHPLLGRSIEELYTELRSRLS